MTRDPWKTTRLIGRTCTGRDTFSEAVRMVEGFLVPSGPRRQFCWPAAFNETRLLSCATKSIESDCHHPVVADRPRLDLSVTIGPGKHLIPFRTQK